MENKSCRSDTLCGLYRIISDVSTFLSPNVYELVVKKNNSMSFVDRKDYDFRSLTYVRDDGLIKCNELPFLNEGEERLYSREWYEYKIASLIDVMQDAYTWLLSASEEQILNSIELCSWMHNPDIVSTCFNLLRRKPVLKAEVVECLLLFVAVLDRALGNVFHLTSPGKAVPFLIRDLLLTDELKMAIGKKLVLLLQLFMGSPLSLNLRNLAWHGFLTPNELTPHHVATLLLIAASIGNLLSKREIPARPAARLVQPEYSFPTLEVEAFRVAVGDLYETSAVVHPTCRPLWLLALQRFDEAQFGRCLVLLLPQLENLLRCIFAVVNRSHSRILTAESDVLYVTMDTVLADTFIEGDIIVNRLVDVIGISALMALRDVFSFFEGPRLRDRLSHGECKIDEIERRLANHIIALTAAVLLTCELREFSEPEKYLINCLNQYEPSFHPASILKSELVDAVQSIDTWSKILQEITKELGLKLTQVEPCISIEHLMVKKWLSEKDADICLLHSDVKNAKLNYEETFLASSNYRQVVQDIVKGSRNLIVSIEDYYADCKTRKLRSRQRVTFFRLLDLCPEFIYASKLCILPFILHILGATPSVVVSEKLLKIFNKFAANLASLSRADKNRWLELGECSNSVILCYKGHNNNI